MFCVLSGLVQFYLIFSGGANLCSRIPISESFAHHVIVGRQILGEANQLRLLEYGKMSVEIQEICPELQVNVHHNEFVDGLRHLLVVEGSNEEEVVGVLGVWDEDHLILDDVFNIWITETKKLLHLINVTPVFICD